MSEANLEIIPAPQSPESSWTRTPLSCPPSPTLLYQCVASLNRNEGSIFSIAVLKGNIFTGSSSKRIRVWRQKDYVERGYLKTGSGNVYAMLTYGDLLFTTHRDNKVRIWRVSKGLLYTCLSSNTVTTWRISDQRCIDSFVAHMDTLNAIVVNQEDGFVFTCSSDGSVKLWRRMFGANSHILIMTLTFQSSPVNALALSSSINYSYLYSASSDGSIDFWEKEKVSGRYNHAGFLKGHQYSVLCLATVGEFVVSGSEDTTIRVWRRGEESNIHECLVVLNAHNSPVRCLATSSEVEKVCMGVLLFSASSDGTFKVWRLKIFPEENNQDKCRCSIRMRERPLSELNGEIIPHDMSPVLSPSWVEKKLQGDHIH